MFFFTWILAHTQDGERGRPVWARSIQLKWSLSGGETPQKKTANAREDKLLKTGELEGFMGKSGLFNESNV